MFEESLATVNIAIGRVRLAQRDNPPETGRALAVALTKLEEAEMWLQRAQALAS